MFVAYGPMAIWPYMAKMLEQIDFQGRLNKWSETDLNVKYLFKFVLTRCIDLLYAAPI